MKSRIPTNGANGFNKTSREKIAVARSQLNLEAELGRVLRALSLVGIEPILLKGPHLSTCFYEDPLERKYADIDLIVRENDIGRAVESLKKSGWKDIEEDVQYYSSFSDYRHHAEMVSPRRVYLDLHRDFTFKGKYRTNIEEMFERSVYIRVGRLNVRVLCNEDMLLGLCLHAAQSDMNIKASNLVDIANVTKKGGIDWDAFLRRAKSAGARVVSYYCLQSAIIQKGAVVPVNVMEALKPGAVRMWWLARNLDMSKSPLAQKKFDRFFGQVINYQLPLIDNIRDWPPLLVVYFLFKLERGKKRE